MLVIPIVTIFYWFLVIVAVLLLVYTVSRILYWVWNKLIRK